MKFFYLLLSLLLLFLTFTGDAFGVEKGSVIINEVGWAGTISSYYDEWLELYNTYSTEISLKDWSVYIDGEKIVTLQGKILPKSYYLIERASDDVIADIKASEVPTKWSKGLVNNGGYLELKDAEGIIIDSVSCKSKWCAGDSKNKKSMERDSGGSWHTAEDTSLALDSKGNKVYGTPLHENSNFADTTEDTADEDSSVLSNSMNNHDVAIDFDLEKSSGNMFVLTPKVSGIDMDRIYRIRVICECFIWSGGKKGWLYFTDAWNNFPKFEESKSYKVLVNELDFDIRVEIRDSLSLKIFSSSAKHFNLSTATIEDSSEEYSEPTASESILAFSKPRENELFIVDRRKLESYPSSTEVEEAPEKKPVQTHNTSTPLLNRSQLNSLIYVLLGASFCGGFLFFAKRFKVLKLLNGISKFKNTS